MNQNQSEHDKPKFGVVPFVLFGILMACVIFPGLTLKAITPAAAGLAIFVWVAIPHMIGLYISIREANTKAAIVIMLFLGFWLDLTGLIFLPAEDINKALLYIEPGIWISVTVIQWFYRKDKWLQRLLWALGLTVFYLWISKIFHSLEPGIPWLVWGLGLCVLVTVFKKLKESEKPLKKILVPPFSS